MFAPITPQQRAEQAADLALKAMNARKSDIAIQTCILNITEPISQEAVFAQPSLTWPSSKASAYFAMYDEVAKIPVAKFTKASDKDLLLKFLTEQLGIEGAKQKIRDKLGKDIPDSDFEVFHGPHVVNVYYKDDKLPSPTGQTFVAEAKGGSSQLKGDQGTMKNLKKEAKLMSNSNFNSRKSLPGESPADQKKRVKEEKERRRDVGDDLELELASKNVTFVTVRTPTDPSKKPKIEKEEK